MKKIILEDECWESEDYVEEVTGSRPASPITLEELEEMELPVWNYPLTEIDHIIENELSVVLVRFPEMYGGYTYRFCEMPDDETKESIRSEIDSEDDED